jgi:hypothetical protein
MPSIQEIGVKLLEGAAISFGKDWGTIESYARTEFQKMAIQLADIADNVAQYELDNSKGYSPETGKALIRMQRNACESVFVAMTHLTLVAVQNMLDEVFSSLRSAFGGTFSKIL